MAKILSAKQKADELGISTRALAKTRHLYKHIPKSPRKFLYFPEELKEAVRPIMHGSTDSSVKSRSNRRRNVPFGEENYHKCPSGSGHSLQRRNQLRSKLAYEGKHTDEEIKSVDQATEYHITKKHKEIVEEKQRELQTKIRLEDERSRKASPNYYGGMLTGPNPIPPVVTHSTPWKSLNPKEPDEYERYTKEHLADEKKFEYY